ncbi:MAG: PEP/pyruvate-binding domain-containing protein [bacterium]
MHVINHFGLIGHASVDPSLYGGKGAHLAALGNMGFPVPRGFTIPTDWCNVYLSMDTHGREKFLLNTVLPEVVEAYECMQGDIKKPFLVSVRSGAKVSMPGMMDTVLNVGLTPDNFSQWESKLGEIPVRDSYRRLIQMYSDVVIGKEALTKSLSRRFKNVKTFKFDGVLPKTDQELTLRHLDMLINWYRHDYMKATKSLFPGTLQEQLITSIKAVFESWNSPRAIHYRKMNNIPDDLGTSVTIQKMVFGNLNKYSGSGVLFTRNPSTGENKVMGEFLVNAQGEDVVAGIRTPLPISKMEEQGHVWKEVSHILHAHAIHLEEHFKDAQDIEFTVEDGNLYLLQTRSAKRTPEAAFRIAYSFVQEKKCSITDAMKLVSYKQYQALSNVSIVPGQGNQPFVSGIPACPGVAIGEVVFSSEKAVQEASEGKDVILVTLETTPEDISGMEASKGILTVTGGATSHAAVVAREMNKPCVVGAIGLELSSLSEGTVITLDGASGKVWKGSLQTQGGGTNYYAKRLLSLVKATDSGSYLMVDSSNTDSLEHPKLWIDAGSIPLPMFESLLMGLNKKAAILSSVIIDFSGVTADEATKKYLSLFGGLQPYTGMEDKEALLNTSKFDSLKAITSIIPQSPIPGWKEVLRVNTVTELLASISKGNEFMIPTDDLVKNVGADGISSVLQFAVDSGYKVAPLPTPIHGEDLAKLSFGG